MLRTFLKILHTAFTSFQCEKSLPMPRSTPYFKSQILSLLRFLQKITQRTSPLPMIKRILKRKRVRKKSESVINLSWELIVALYVANLSGIIIINGGKDENSGTHHREAEGTWKETCRIRRNGQVVLNVVQTGRISAKEIDLQRMERKFEKLLQG